MISVDIEKEIKKDNKVFMNLNIRQLISVVIGVVLALLLKIITGLPVDMLVGPYIAVGAVVAYFGWPHKNKMTAEQIIKKKISRMVYKNETRTYRTLNSYVVMLNKAYALQKQKDLSNKAIARKFKNQKKRNMKKRSKLKGIA